MDGQTLQSVQNRRGQVAVLSSTGTSRQEHPGPVGRRLFDCTPVGRGCSETGNTTMREEVDRYDPAPLTKPRLLLRDIHQMVSCL